MFNHDFSIPEGSNESLKIAVSSNGVVEIGRKINVPARCGIAIQLTRGQQLTIVNPSGRQVCDFFAFAAEDLHEHLSMAHVHTSLGSIFPKVGDDLVSNLRRPFLTITEDTSPGIHDTVIACCDLARYRELGCDAYHDNCADNLRMSLMAIGLKAPLIPAPLNIWMNVPIEPDGSTSFQPPVASAGDRFAMQAKTDVIAVMSACPQDITPVNGAGVEPSTLEFSVADG